MDKMTESLGSTKVGAVPAWASKNLTPAKLGEVWCDLQNRYASKHFRKPGRITPLVHAMVGLSAFGYWMNYHHLVHDRNRKHH
eukprot:m.34184 g.34184  ORF g.34184 m.34184 type:complete len:83 (+) comp11114_c0_seq1:681-929(+)